MGFDDLFPQSQDTASADNLSFGQDAASPVLGAMSTAIGTGNVQAGERTLSWQGSDGDSGRWNPFNRGTGFGKPAVHAAEGQDSPKTFLNTSAGAFPGLGGLGKPFSSEGTVGADSSKNFLNTSLGTFPSLGSMEKPSSSVGGQTSTPDPLGPSSIPFVNAYEASPKSDRASADKYSLGTQGLGGLLLNSDSLQTDAKPSFGLFKSGEAFQGNEQRPLITPKSGEPMIASFEAAQNQQGQLAGNGGNGFLASNVNNDAGNAGQVTDDPLKGVNPFNKTAPLTEAPQVRPDLGESTKRFESGTKGPSTVSNPKNKDEDKGGVSYGTYQFSSEWGAGGTVKEFLKSPEGQKFAAEFKDLTPGSPEFTAKWQQIAATDADGLHQAEKAYIYRTHYQPNAKVAADMGLDMDNPAVQDAVWSSSVQHGPGGFQKVLRGVENSNPNMKTMSTEDQLKAIYWARQPRVLAKDWNSRGGRYFGLNATDMGEFETVNALNKAYNNQKMANKQKQLP